ncbi:MAG: putative sugar nucleotidyl transferase [Gemmatimonadota bacterium]|nr:putative sugar nucleotidyl transferase [Gemmatimonadota bacterium]
MSGHSLYLFDDARARDWAPLSLTRPVGEILLGCLTLRARAERVFSTPCQGHLVEGHVRHYREHDAPPGMGADEVGSQGLRIVLSSRAVLAFQDLPRQWEDGPVRLTIDGETVGWRLPPGTPTPSRDHLSEPGGSVTGAAIALRGSVLGDPWDLIAENAHRIETDAEHLRPGVDAHPAGVVRLGSHPLVLGDGATVEPGVVVDSRTGPVVLDDDVVVQGPARLVGPLFVGRGTTILGGSVERSSIGPVCKIRGEVSESVILGYSNKAHDGFLGHALVGRWVNLGAMTTNSDLKNNYGTVRVWTPAGPRDTGLMKVGCFLGDHVRTGIGTLLNTGTVVGAGSNVFGSGSVPSMVAPFSWVSRDDTVPYRIEKFLEVAERAMARRDVDLTDELRLLYEGAWAATAEWR